MTVVRGGLMSYLRYLCLLPIVVSNTYCVVFYVLSFFVLCTLFCQFLRIVHFWLPLRYSLRRVWRYQRGNQNPYIEEQTTQWPKEKVQKDKQRSTKHTYKTKDRVTRTPLKTGGELRCSGRVSSSCSTSLYRNPIAIANLVPKMFGCKSESIIISLFSIWICVIQS
jgi:hypothetical protein